MGFLNPLFLLAAAAVAVPLVLHLFHRHEGRRIAFPALRYLRRTRKEHARTIRFRQLLLLLIRIATILLVVSAGARLFLPGTGGQHPPTALAIVLDNSLSSGAVEGEERVLDRLRALALASVEKAGPEDRIWVLRAGEPWDVAIPGGPEEARRTLEETVVSAAAGDLPATLERAAALVAGAGLEAAEIHLLSDLQASALPVGRTPAVPEGVRLVVHRPSGSAPPNRFLSGLEIGGGLVPLAGERTGIAARVEGVGVEEEPLVRLVWGDRVRTAAEADDDGFVLLPLGPLAEGWISGFLEIDPDALSDDDRRYFAFPVRAPPRVAVQGEAPFFLASALSVLEEGGRASPAAAEEADVLFAVGGAGLDGRAPGTPALVLPPSDETTLPALNRRLAAAGIPWSYEPAESGGEIRVQEQTLPWDLGAVRVHRHYRLVRTGGDAGGEVRATLATGAPWMVSGEAGGGPYFLFASPLELEATNLPVSAPMIPLFEWLLGEWAAPSGHRTGVVAGEPIPLPTGATGVVAPGGTLHPVNGTQSFRRSGEVGIYQIVRQDSVLAHVAVNAPLEESRLERLAGSALAARLGGDATIVSGGWERAILQGDEGAEAWRPLLLLALLLLLLESWIAAAGAGAARGAPAEPARVRRPLKHT